MTKLAGFALLASLFAATAAANPWANTVVSYAAGTGVPTGYNNPNAALGSPAIYDDSADTYGMGIGDVTPINAPYGSAEVVTLGKGGSITLSFDSPVTNDPLNPYGIDLLVFGNSFVYWDPDNHVTLDGIYTEGGTIEISSNGTAWTLVSALADTSFPTCAWTDWTDAWGHSGAQLSDFTKPVNPSLNITANMTIDDLKTMYAGSGGGSGIDIGNYGFDAISFIRISNAGDSLTTPEIDAVADVSPVPEPSATAMLAAGVAVIFAWRRRSRAS